MVLLSIGHPNTKGCELGFIPIFIGMNTNRCNKQKKLRHAQYLRRHNRLKLNPSAYREHLEKLKKRSKEWREKYSKIRILTRMAWRVNGRCKKGSITGFDLWRVAKKQKLMCALTSEKLTAENISVDHIIPKKNGGTNDVSNLRLVTIYANRAKSDLTDKEFLILCENVTKTIGK